MQGRQYVPPSGAGQVIFLLRVAGAATSRVIRLFFLIAVCVGTLPAWVSAQQLSVVAPVAPVVAAQPSEFYFPGSVWTSNGTFSPVEKGNFISLTHAEQGVAWHGAELFAHLTLSDDSKGFAWNHRVQDGVGLRFTQSLGNGMVRAGLIYTHEAREPQVRAGQWGVFVESWFGWRQQPTKQPVYLPIPAQQRAIQSR